MQVTVKAPIVQGSRNENDSRHLRLCLKLWEAAADGVIDSLRQLLPLA